MALSVLQRKNNSSTSSQTTIAATFTSNVTSGSLIIACVGCGNSGVTLSNVKDNVNNANFTQAVNQDFAGHFLESWIMYFPNSAAGAMTVTATFSVAQGFPEIFLVEVGGAATSSPVDVTGSSTGTGATPTSGNITTTNANDILVGHAVVGSGITAGESGWTNTINANSDAEEDIIESSTGTFAATWSQTSADYCCTIASFKAASGSTVTLPSTTMQAALGITAPSPKGLIAGGASVNLKGFFGISGQIGKLAISSVSLKALLGIASAQSPGKATAGDPPYAMWGGGF